MDLPEYGLRQMFLPDETPAEALERLTEAKKRAPDEIVCAQIADAINWLVKVYDLKERHDSRVG